MFSSLLSLIGFVNFQPWMIAVIVPVVALLFTGVILVSGMYFQHRRRELWHATARAAVEKGQPIPEPSPDSPSPSWNGVAGTKSADPAQRARGYFIGGLINIGTAAGLAIAFWKFVPLVSYLAAIPACIGVSLLLAAWVEARAANKTQP